MPGSDANTEYRPDNRDLVCWGGSGASPMLVQELGLSISVPSGWSSRSKEDASCRGQSSFPVITHTVHWESQRVRGLKAGDMYEGGIVS